MQIAGVAFSVIIVLAGVVFNFDKTSYRSPINMQPPVLGTTTNTESPSPTPVATIAPTNNTYIYPNSRVVSQENNLLVLESSDPANIITDWYQEKIRDQGFNVKSFVKTNVNGKVENKLKAASADSEIEVEIKKEPNVTNATIIVRY